MCTTFTKNINEHFLLGQNYDFYYGHGLIVVSPRGLNKFSLSEEEQKRVEWVSKYGNVTFTQFGRELPMSGMNENGLAIAMMFHEDGELPVIDNRPSLNELQWIQYQLDNFGSVEEVLKHLEDVRIEKSIYALHYTVCDITGETVLIEFINGKAKVIDKATHYMITNTSYELSLEYAKQFESKSIQQLSRKTTSLDRFTLAYRLIEQVSQQPSSNAIDQAFLILKEVSIKPSLQSMWNWIGKKIPPTFTYWSIVFDVNNFIIYFKDHKNKNIRQLSLQQFDFDKLDHALSLPIDNQLSGDITGIFTPYSTKDNERIIYTSYKPISHLISKADQEELITYPDQFYRV
ncbi:linear amide C-N hydrolase [Aquibacillus rhizosphaerae]|uniref:Linear amide C-N hydrolase n=1 Tax=Aquibacillus rhizosphaerae TaxID=3051431 RepID=A0ABT7L993_9BACI|nr:linear amide C-N hydrolase [Aquibacillus sp. LR5S19]MDL4842432.1 linear amide C-N hydrolase [Aquibacillus sp. LR5S19]